MSDVKNIEYKTILGANQSITGVRGLNDSKVLCTGSTQSNGATVGMWWFGSLETGRGEMVVPTPTFSGQTVTSSMFYGPNTGKFDQKLKSNIRIVGSYKYSGSDLTSGLIYEGPLNGSGTWTAINVPSSSVGGKSVKDTIPHSVMGNFVVGNFNLQNDPMSGNAFLYNISTKEYTIFSLNKMTSAYGIWQNGKDSYTIAGGSNHMGLDKAYLMDYNAAEKKFGSPSYFFDSSLKLTHFEGITGTKNGYNLAGTSLDKAQFISVSREDNGSFGKAAWTTVEYPGSSLTTANTIYENILIGVYAVSGVDGMNCYRARVSKKH